MYTLSQYLVTLSDLPTLSRTLGDAAVCRDARGRPLFSAGNSAVVFRIRCRGHTQALRCYIRPMPHLREIYAERFLPQELYVYTSPSEGEWVDAVLCDWIEGETLHEAVVAAGRSHDAARFARLADAFDTLAAELIEAPTAHGDLKPENIVVDAAGGLYPIDFDAAYLPAFAGERSPELGTAAFQHPTRTAADFDASLDDFPAALLSTALHALALDPSLYDRYGDRDGLLFEPRAIRSDPALQEALALFERSGHAVQYRIGRLLFSPSLRLPGLGPLLRRALAVEALPPAELANASPEQLAGHASEPALELFVEGGLWGFRTAERIVIPPLYDSGFDFTEGLAAVCLGRTWHFIDTAGRTVVSLPGCRAVKPFRAGRARVIGDQGAFEIDRMGRKLDN